MIRDAIDYRGVLFDDAPAPSTAQSRDASGTLKRKKKTEVILLLLLLSLSLSLCTDVVYCRFADQAKASDELTSSSSAVMPPPARSGEEIDASLLAPLRATVGNAPFITVWERGVKLFA